MRMLLVAAVAVLVAGSAGCEKTVREARNSTSREQQQLRRPAFAPRTASRTSAQARPTVRSASAAPMRRNPSLPPQLRGQTASAARGSALLPAQKQSQKQAQPAPSLVRSVLNYPKKYLSKLAKII